MPKRKCDFTDALKAEYKFLKKSTKIDETDKVECTVCGGIFSVEHGGKSDITQHIATKRHKTASLASTSAKVSDFFSKKVMGEVEKNLAADEATFAYHTCFHNQSFRSMDCTSKIIRKLYDRKFTCGQTKTQALIVNVLAPFAIKQFKLEMEKANYISILIDASNHGASKLVPLMVRYFVPEKGVKTMILEFTDLPSETAERLTDYIWDLLKSWKIEDKVVALSADNTNTNFGGCSRKGRNNVYHKLRTRFGRGLIGVGCSAHIMNNAMQTAADTLPVDIEAVISKIFQHFYIYSVRVQSLKEFCQFVDSEYKTVLGHSKTRWLSLHPAIKRLNEMYEGLKAYFLSIDKCPTILKDFFQNPVSKLFSTFLELQCEMFHTTISSLEGETISFVEAQSIIQSLVGKIEMRRDENLTTTTEKKILLELQEEGLISEKAFQSHKIDFYNTCVSYIKEWSQYMLKLDSMSWVKLRTALSWENVLQTVQTINQTAAISNIVESDLFDEVMMVKTALKSKGDIEVKDMLKSKHLDQVWVDLLKSVEGELSNLKKLVEFVMCIPGTNACVERLFSHMNALWTAEKNKLSVKTVKSMLIVKSFFSEDCVAFHDMILKNKQLLSEIHSSDKYKSEED